MVVRWACLFFPEVLVRIQLVTRPIWSDLLVLLVLVIFSSFFLPPGSLLSPYLEAAVITFYLSI